MSQEDFYKKNCTIVKEYRNIYEECKDYDIMTLNIRKAKYKSWSVVLPVVSLIFSVAMHYCADLFKWDIGGNIVLTIIWILILSIIGRSYRIASFNIAAIEYIENERKGV